MGPQPAGREPAEERGRSAPGCLGLARRLPVTTGIAAVTLAFFALEALAGGTTDVQAQLRLGALRADLVFEQGEWFRLLCAVFLHQGWIHLGLNGLAFVQLGALTEQVYGSWRLLAIYLLCGLAGSLLSALCMTPLPGGSRGASGAIMGLAGLLLVASWVAAEPTRGLLRTLFGRRLLFGVLLTFGLGVGLLLVLPIIDNWGHLGGFLTGVAASLLLRHPERPEGRPARALALLLSAATLVAFAWMATAGERAAERYGLDLARYVRSQLAEPDGLVASTLLAEMVSGCEEAGARQAALDALAEVLPRCQEAGTPLRAAAFLYAEERGTRHDLAVALLLERAVELAPDDREALNMLAWHLVTRPNEALRDPRRAEELSVRSLRGLTEEHPDQRRMLAAYLDTHDEALLQLDRWGEALAEQQRAVRLAQAEGDRTVLADLELRLAGILEHEGRTTEALEAARAAVRDADPENPDLPRMRGLVQRLEAASGAPAR